jgi:hypothetical protein
MPFKPPGGELTVWSGIWVAFGVAAVVVAWRTGLPSYYVLGACVGLPVIGMWFDQRWCGYLLAGILAITILIALFALWAIDDTLSARAYRLVRMGMAAYFAFISFRWARSTAIQDSP